MIRNSLNGFNWLTPNSTNESPFGEGTDYPDFASYAKAQGYVPLSQGPDWSSLKAQAYTPIAYVGQTPLNDNEWANFFAARYGKPTTQQSQVNPLSNGQIGSNVALGQSIMGGLK